jgi:hypothetical protein
MNKPMKKFALSAAELKPLATGRGGCIATDEITVEGRPVGYMVREEPIFPEDSGWAFQAGDETQAYMANPSNHGVFDVNTIANLCPDIIPLLDSPPPVAFARLASGQLVQVPHEAPLD